jgi:hypothetical protein
MISTEQLRSQVERLVNGLGLPAESNLEIRFFDREVPRILADVAIYLGDECMALGRFSPVKVNDISGEDFTQRFCMAMSYPEDAWYLFDFDGEKMVINDLSLTDPINDHPPTLESGFRRLTTLPSEWQAEQKKLDEMLRFVESMRYLIDEEAINNPVK